MNGRVGANCLVVGPCAPALCGLSSRCASGQPQTCSAGRPRRRGSPVTLFTPDPMTRVNSSKSGLVYILFSSVFLMSARKSMTSIKIGTIQRALNQSLSKISMARRCFTDSSHLLRKDDTHKSRKVRCFHSWTSYRNRVLFLHIIDHFSRSSLNFLLFVYVSCWRNSISAHRLK